MIHRQDDTFVIDFNSMPYHLTADCEPEAGLYELTLTRYMMYPEKFEEESEQQPVATTAEELRIREIHIELARIDSEYRTPRTLAEAAQGVEYALTRLAEAEVLAKPLRAELKTLEAK